MTKKVADLKQLNKELSDALTLLNDKVDGPKSGRSATGSLPEGSESLLNRCAQISNQSMSEKPLVRVIHHFACSGGHTKRCNNAGYVRRSTLCRRVGEQNFY